MSKNDLPEDLRVERTTTWHSYADRPRMSIAVSWGSGRTYVTLTSWGLKAILVDGREPAEVTRASLREAEKLAEAAIAEFTRVEVTR